MPTPKDIRPAKTTEPEPSSDEPAPEPLTTDRWTEGLSPTEKRAKLREIREWARAQGHDVPAKGRIPQAALAAYDAATSETEITLAADLNRLKAVTETPAATPDAAQPLAESSHDPNPLGMPGEEPETEEEAPATEPAAKDEEMGHPNAYTDILDETRTRIDATEPATTPDGMPHPEWAAVTVPEEIERLRALAARLEQECAEQERLKTEAHRALSLALNKWATATDALTEALEEIRYWRGSARSWHDLYQHATEHPTPTAEQREAIIDEYHQHAKNDPITIVQLEPQRARGIRGWFGRGQA